MMYDQNFAWLFRQYFSKRRGVLLVAVVLSILQSLLLLPSVYFIKRIFDSDIPNGSVSGLLINSSIIILFTILQSALSFVHRNYFLKIVKQGMRQLQQDVIEHFIGADKKFFDTTDRAVIANNTVFDIEKIDKFISGFLGVIIPQLTLLGIGLIIMLVYNPVIGLATIALGFIAVFGQRMLKKRVIARIKDYDARKDQLSAYASFLPNKVVLIKSRNNEKNETSSAKQISENLMNAAQQAATKGWDMRVANEVIVNTSATLLIVLGSLQILLGSASFGEIFGLYFIIVFLRRTATLLQGEWINLNEGVVALEKIHRTIDNIKNSMFSKNGMGIDFNGNIELKKVSFAYTPDLPILHEIDLKINQGETVMLTGANGSGKSSILNLILGFYRPSQGDVLAEGVGYDKISVGKLREKIGYVPQQQIVIDGTLEENLFYGLSNPPKDELNHLMKDAFFSGFVAGLENGLKTNIVKDGKNLSGGQIQYMSIIRALLQRPELLILDEPTNHLDGQAIASLINNIREKKNISILIISHHEIFKNVVDRTYHLENGRLLNGN